MATPTNLFQYYQGQNKPLPSVAERAPTYAQYGGQGNYTGTTEQNQFLLGKLTSGGQVLGAETAELPVTTTPTTQQPAQPVVPTQPATSPTQIIPSSPQVPVDPNKPLTPEETLKKAQDDYQIEAQKTHDSIVNIQNGTIPLDAGQLAQIEGLKQQFQQLIDQQKLTNTGAEGLGNVRGYQTGAAEYDPTFQAKTIGSIITAGANKISDLNVQMASAVSKLTQAFKDDNIRGVKEAWDIYNQASEKRTEELQKTVDDTQKAIKEAQDAQAAADKDAAISELYSSGITDVPTILSELRKYGITATSKDVADTLKNTGVEDIQKIIQDASKSGATLAQIHELSQAKSPAEASGIVAKYGLGQSESDKLDMEYKRAQIDKIRQEINDSGIKGVDPGMLFAYAQQYAADGKIPTGIPKGTFGVIAQAAKELPKSKGQIIDNNTGVAPVGDTTLANSLASLSSVVDLAKQLKELDQKRVGGIISGVGGKIFGSKDQQRYVDLRSQIVDLLSRARSGAALTPSEEARYSGMLPGRFSESFGLGTDSEARIDNFINNITSDLNNKAGAKGWSIYGVSTVTTPSGTFKVGETITDPQSGVSFRVNSDGTKTII